MFKVVVVVTKKGNLKIYTQLMCFKEILYCAFAYYGSSPELCDSGLQGSATSGREIEETKASERVKEDTVRRMVAIYTIGVATH
jgi:hypothetical protein